MTLCGGTPSTPACATLQEIQGAKGRTRRRHRDLASRCISLAASFKSAVMSYAARWGPPLVPGGPPLLPWGPPPGPGGPSTPIAPQEILRLVAEASEVDDDAPKKLLKFNAHTVVLKVATPCPLGALVSRRNDP